ncbi:MAG TPA: NAD+ synthase [Armatimonadota bacterium]|jgi:NAD+ synthase (glutamine-hydrolysing)
MLTETNPDSQVPAPVRLGLVQLNSTVGDLAGNTDRIIAALRQANDEGCDIVAFPELAITGYPPEDLLLKPRFLHENVQCLQRIAEAQAEVRTAAIVGFVDVSDDISNAAAIIAGGRVAGVHHKIFLPSYSVFDEDRYFAAGEGTSVFNFGDVGIGVGVCEDIWYSNGPAREQALVGGAEVLVSINASPFHREKWRSREHLLAARAMDNTAFVAYVNSVGGQDELLFDGHSLVFDPGGELIARGPSFEEALVVVDLNIGDVFHRRLANPSRRKERMRTHESGLAVALVDLPPFGEAGQPRERLDAPSPSTPSPIPVWLSRLPLPPPDMLSDTYNGLVLGVRDYVRKNGFKDVVLGLSGGIDSAITACIAVDALGKDHVIGVTMPSRYSSDETKSDAALVAENLGIRFLTVPIEGPFQASLDALADSMRDTGSGLAEENLQARIRGNYLMTLSNKFGWLVLTTGNKSEMSVGYSTLYGDMAGGFAVIKDVPKTLVYALSEYRNTLSPVIPESTITRPPTAELRPDQKDTDSLPPYDVLDAILNLYVEDDRSLEEIVSAGFDEATVRRVILMVDRNEYKRRQAPPGIKITPKAFGRDRRLPITNRYHDW